MSSQFERTEKLIGKENQKKLFSSKVAIYGIGGVGSFACEALARAGVCHFVLVDKDKIDITNLNRQIHATHDTIGKDKAKVMKERILKINPDAQVEIYSFEQMEKPEEEIIDSSFSYIADCVDTITTKLKLIEKAKKEKIPIISAMGAGNKLDPTKFEVADIFNTSMCPLCKVMRKELKKREISHLKVVYSKEEPVHNPNGEKEAKERIIGSISFVPSVAGLILAGEIVKDIIKNRMIRM